MDLPENAEAEVVLAVMGHHVTCLIEVLGLVEARASGPGAWMVRALARVQRRALLDWWSILDRDLDWANSLEQGFE